MWKKFLAVMAIVGVMSSNATALTIITEEGYGNIDNLTASPSPFDPVDGESTTISFDLSDSTDIYAYVANTSGTKIYTTFANLQATAAGKVTYVWYGTVGNTPGATPLSNGTYTINVHSFSNGTILNSSTITAQINSSIVVDDEDEPNIINLRANPSTFSIEDDEDTDIRFGVDQDAYVEVVIKQGTSIVRTFTNYNSNDFYDATNNHLITWDGRKNNGSYVNEGTYRAEVRVSNSEGTDLDTVTIFVDNDGSSSSSDLIEDFDIDPRPEWNPKKEDLEIEFELTDDVDDLLVEAREIDGNDRVEIEDDNNADEGDYNFSWDGRDEDNDYVDEGDWEIVVIADGEKVSKKVEIDYSAKKSGKDDECHEEYWDLDNLDEDNELCVAIAWVTEEDIFSGYPDGAFRPYQNINRAEVLKVVLEAFDNVDILSASGSKEGFSDVDPHAWYMKYVRTAKFYSMLDGYPDGTARLANPINRVELLKFVLEASESFTSYEFVNGYDYDEPFYSDVDPFSASQDWFVQYADAAFTYDLYNTYVVDGKEYLRPGQLVERGEVALLLYRMDKEGLLN